MRPTDLQLDIDTYAGPFDLLCTLLLRRELPIEDVGMAEIVVAYVQRLAHEERVDPNTASEFLLLVAGLMEIKAREILSEDAELLIEDAGSVEAQADMLERLVRYTTYRQASSWLGAQAPAARWWRVASRPVVRTKRTYDGPVMDPMLLHRSMTVLASQSDVDVRHLVGTHASVHEMTGRLMGLLRHRRTFQLDEVFEGLSRLDQAVAFVAALELCKNGHAQLSQADAFGPITVAQQEAGELGETTDGDGAPDEAAAGEREFQTA